MRGGTLKLKHGQMWFTKRLTVQWPQNFRHQPHLDTWRFRKGWFLCPRKIFVLIESQTLERLNVCHDTSIDLTQTVLASVWCDLTAERQDVDCGGVCSQSRRIPIENIKKMCVFLTLEMLKLQINSQHMNALSPHWFRCDGDVQKQHLLSDPFNN